MKQSLALIFFLLSEIAFSDDSKISIVKKLVDSYQEAALTQTSNNISVVFAPEEALQATAKIYDDKNVITIYAQMMKDFEPLELVTITCHELGHLLGDVREGNKLLDGDLRQFREAVEGEADYFAGSCLRKFIEENNSEVNPVELAQNVAANAYQKLTHSNEPIQVLLAQDKEITGILPAYPGPECRLLSVFSGIENKERPKCWYNPR